MVGSCQTVLQFSSTAFVITYKISTRVNISLRPGRGGSEEGSGFQGDSTRSLLLSRHRLVTDGTHTPPTAQWGCCAAQQGALTHLSPWGTSLKTGQNCTELHCSNVGPVLLNINKPMVWLMMEGKGAKTVWRAQLAHLGLEGNKQGFRLLFIFSWSYPTYYFETPDCC